MITFLAVSGVLFWLLVIGAIWLVTVAVVRGVKKVRTDRAAATTGPSIADQAKQYLREEAGQ